MPGAPLRFLELHTERVTLWLARVGAVVLAVMMFMTFFDVIGRYFFNSPIVGTVDMTELFMGLIVYLGIGLTTFQRGHISVDLLTTRLPTRLHLVFDLFAQVVSGTLAAAISWRLWVIATETVANNDVTRVWELPIYPVVFALAAASVMMVVAFLVLVIGTLAALAGGRAS